MQRENQNPATNDVTQSAEDGTELPIVIPTPLAPQTSVTIAAEAEEKSAQEAVVPQPVTFQFSSQPATALQQRQPEAVEEKRKCRFDVLQPEIVEIFRRGMFRNNTELDFCRSVVTENFAFFNGKYIGDVTVDNIVTFLSATIRYLKVFFAKV
ncbi:MAG TPA: hypothetical protein VNK03_04205 [Gammaproteobacteria bacterium]|nr:hypothetical protein [Gammaproteobacteria bacterium]